MASKSWQSTDMEKHLFRKLTDVWLKMGDVLLVQGQRANVSALETDTTLRVLGAVEQKRPNLRRAPLAIVIFTGVLLATTFEVLSLPVAALLGAVMFLYASHSP